ncbi:ATP-binding cassette domain-containing protein [Rhodopseudomonas palustris]|uniref:ABC transporter ATP-binding protein n=1 Tax=Rhodopseudomonas TaxID=1073 RepID=UPI0006B8E88B|nr:MULTISPECIES: ATP-binding cassette domain-containing protein [Rhodopseudomonas]KPF95667.1 branched-chain amino acid ABC transporter ATP-binding protein [Rhodopseudomonas sp. AAP120]MCP9630395.1 ATP-binding cassette domain-containing protein [Rhodopseudomonas palustris]
MIEGARFGCEGVSLSLGGRQILKNVGLAVRGGEMLGLIGPNGAGKTSLFEVLSGRYVPQRGEVFLDQQPLGKLDIFQRARRGVARTYQSPVVPNSLTVGEVFRAARKAYRPYMSVHDAEWAARLVGLEVSWSRLAGTLDTFDRRKLLLACLMMRRPQVLLMDEPASGLINTEIAELDLLLRKLVDEYHIAVILIEHRLELLGAIADRIVVLDLGAVIAEGDPETVFKDPKVRAAYFEGAA